MFLNKDSFTQQLSKKEYSIIMQYAMEQDSMKYVKRANKTSFRMNKFTYHVLNKTQTDSGANCSVTKNKNLLHKYQKIPAHGINGVKAEEEAIKVIGKGYIKWTSQDEQTLWIPCYYSPDVEDTIISPSDVALSYKHLYSGYTCSHDTDTGTGHIKYINRNGLDHATFKIYMENGLWFSEEAHLEPQSSVTNNNTPRKH